MNILSLNGDVESKMICLRGKTVILDFEVARLYDVETKHINQAVKNNADKFPKGYVIELTLNEIRHLQSKNLTAISMTRSTPKAFTEKGLYMLATILRSEKATQTTLAIIEAYSKLRELNRNSTNVYHSEDPAVQKELLVKSTEIITELTGNNLNVKDTETTIELNLTILKVKHTFKKE